MAGTRVSRPQHDPPDRDAVEGYLAAVTAQLTGSTLARAAVAEELRDGLLETVATHQARGCSDEEAVTAAIAEFGDPHGVAAAFRTELAAVQARRVAVGLLATGPLVGLAWLAAAALSALPPWRHQLPGPWLALPLVGLALAVAGPALGLTVATTGRLGLRLGGRLGQQAVLPPTAAAVAGLAAVLADLTLLAIVGGHALTSPTPTVWAPVLPALALSLTRVVLAVRASRRCLAARAALT
jgi:hypothetical protein